MHERTRDEGAGSGNRERERVPINLAVFFRAASDPRADRREQIFDGDDDDINV